MHVICRSLFVYITLIVAALNATPVLAQKPAKVIRGYVLDQISIDVKPYTAPPLEALLETRVWLTTIHMFGGGMQKTFMAVKDGQAQRVWSHGQPALRNNFLRLLPEGFRVDTEAQARKLVEAATSIHHQFTEPVTSVDEMRVEHFEGTWLFVDGGRFDKATGYRISHDKEGVPTGFEYSLELNTEPLSD